MMTRLRPFLMFQEQNAEEAMNFYVSLFPGAKVTDIQRYTAAGPGPEGTVMRADFTVAGQDVICIDSPAKHAFAFTPSFSFFVDCDSEADLRRWHAALAAGGMELMPPNNYGFSQLFTWLQDRFGVSWQLNLP
ncbi:VOC family protein [Ferrovibrio terrae]|uniref:VOC family protein n=1 Tax=Ferrovibrio terrae TaxID=2594003 RepID=A0A516GWH2_9PROT|nr:VOC family protein [Ferrovibrio terrae]QDO95859.1 VOC family protein [Ferrovibrio terrae]